MPRKSKPRKPVPQPDHVWIAPRPANPSQPRTFEPIGSAPSNRYLEFADIALGSKRPSSRKEAQTMASPVQPKQSRRGKVTPIDSHRPPRQGFGAFRNTR